ncbi:hypothetical protein QE357_005088 [Siphonobacter sp. BAB-5404]|nr:hypothetical protein [Siphonobacter sp. SORGH_AS_0500]
MLTIRHFKQSSEAITNDPKFLLPVAFAFIFVHLYKPNIIKSLDARHLRT